MFNTVTLLMYRDLGVAVISRVAYQAGAGSSGISVVSIASKSQVIILHVHALDGLPSMLKSVLESDRLLYSSSSASKYGVCINTNL